jgi:hypothetical protein
MKRVTIDGCPFCGAEVVMRCRCMRGDSRCANGHEYHNCEEHWDRIVRGQSDHGKSGCSCVPGETFTVGLVPVEAAP